MSTPQAFPTLERGGGGLELSDAGMGLRDYFAAHVIGAAFQDLFAGWRSRGEPVREDWPMGLALDAYRVADAMMKVREGVHYHIGLFDNIDEADKAVREFRAKHGFTENHGRVV